MLSPSPPVPLRIARREQCRRGAAVCRDGRVAMTSRVAAAAVAASSDKEALSQAVKALERTTLQTTSIAVCGDDGDANEALADTLATALGYSLVATSAVMKQLGYAPTGGPEDDADAALLEAAVLEQLGPRLKLCVATRGGGLGAAARGAVWRHLFGHITLWLDLNPPVGASDDDGARGAYAQADIRLQLSGRDGQPGPVGAAAVDGALAVQAVAALSRLVTESPTLPGKKLIYVRMGSRGDWPDLKPPEWQPPT